MKQKVSGIILLGFVMLISAFARLSAQDYISFISPRTNPFNLSTDANIEIKDKGVHFAEFNFDIKGAQLSERIVSGVTYQYIHLEGFSKMDIVGSPALPVYYAMVGVPFHSNMNIEILEEESTIHSAYMIHPALKPAMDTYGAPQPEFELDQSVYIANEWFPKEVAELASIQKLRGLPIAQVAIRPVQFNPVSGELKVYSKLVCRITFEGSDASFHAIGTQNSKHYTDIIKSAVMNPTAIPDGLERQPTDAGEKEYFIIIHDEYTAAADTLARWKRQMGYSVEVVSQSSWTAAQVKTAIQSR